MSGVHNNVIQVICSQKPGRCLGTPMGGFQFRGWRIWAGKRLLAHRVPSWKWARPGVKPKNRTSKNTPKNHKQPVNQYVTQSLPGQPKSNFLPTFAHFFLLSRKPNILRAAGKQSKLVDEGGGRSRKKAAGWTLPPGGRWGPLELE